MTTSVTLKCGNNTFLHIVDGKVIESRGMDKVTIQNILQSFNTNIEPVTAKTPEQKSMDVKTMPSVTFEIPKEIMKVLDKAETYDEFLKQLSNHYKVPEMKLYIDPTIEPHIISYYDPETRTLYVRNNPTVKEVLQGFQKHIINTQEKPIIDTFTFNLNRLPTEKQLEIRKKFLQEEYAYHRWSGDRSFSGLSGCKDIESGRACRDIIVEEVDKFLQIHAKSVINISYKVIKKQRNVPSLWANHQDIEIHKNGDLFCLIEYKKQLHWISVNSSLEDFDQGIQNRIAWGIFHHQIEVDD